MASILFAGMILLSSGFTQFVVHQCAEDGLMLSAESCTMHEVAKDCCQRPQKALSRPECCSDAYFFAVSPKFGSIATSKIQIPFLLVASGSQLQISSNVQNIVHVFRPNDTGPPNSESKTILNQICKLTI